MLDETEERQITFVSQIRTGIPSTILYKLDPPYEGHEYVVSSTTKLYDGVWETMIFPADRDGTITDWNELAVGREASMSMPDKEDALDMIRFD